jgi:hypothetical protein
MVIMNANESEVEHDLKKYIEMLDGYAKGFNVMTGLDVNLNNTIKLPAKTVSIFELK